MKVFIQWATDPKSEPEEFDSSDWNNLPKKPEPAGPQTIDNVKGWVQSLSCMGITFKADHYSISENLRGYPAGTIKITFWNDSGDDEDNIHAGVWIMQDMKLREIEGIKKWVPNLYEERYYSPNVQKKMKDDGITPIFCSGRLVKLHNYSDFIPPDESITKHGVLISESLLAEYELQKDHLYREWV